MGREGVVEARCWIWFRNYVGREEIGEEVTFFVGGLV